MRRRRATTTMLMLAGAALASPAGSGPAAGATGWPAQPRLHLFHLNGGRLDVAREAARRNIIVLNAWEFDLAAQLKKANPAIRVLVYKDLSSTRSYRGAVDNGKDAPLLPTGVGYVEADTSHPDWFALDQQGHRIEWAGFPNHWYMDIGAPAYQQAWLAHVSAEVKDHHWDGVMLDNALTRANAYVSGRSLQRYPDDASLQAATRSMLAAVGPPLRAAGFDVYANIADARLFPGLWNDWLSLLNGACEEHFVTSPGGTEQLFFTGDDFQKQLDQIADAEATGHITMNQAQGSPSDRRARTYALAAYLLVTDGSSTFAYGDPSVPTYPPELAVASRLGSPKGRYRLAGARLYQRQFQGGLVVVNASRDQSADVSTGRGIRSVRPASALILLDHGSSGRGRSWLTVVALLLVLVDVRLVTVAARRNRGRLASLRR